MKILRLVLISVSVLMILFSCEKEVSPEVEITVVDTLNNRVHGAFIQVTADPVENGIIDSNILQTHGTDRFGKAFFRFKHTVLVNIYLVTSAGRIDSTSVFAETKRKRGRNARNVYERTLVFK